MTGTVEEKKKNVNLEHYWNVLKIHSPGRKQHVCLSIALTAAEHHRHFGVVLLTIKILLRGGAATRVDLASSFFPKVIPLSPDTQETVTIFSAPQAWFNLENSSRKVWWPCPRLKAEASAWLPHIAAAASLLRGLFQNSRSWKVSTNSAEAIKKAWCWKIRIADYWSMALMT